MNEITTKLSIRPPKNFVYFDEDELQRSLVDRFEQIVGAAQDYAALLHAVAADACGVGGDELSLTVLADHFPAKVLHPNLQTASARRALLDEISGVRHWRNLLPPDGIP